MTEQLTKLSTETAEMFVDAYYTALQASRPTISTYYHPPSTTPSSKTVPQISYNGSIFPSGGDLQSFFIDQMPYTHFDAQSVDVHTLNVGNVSEDEMKGKVRDWERRINLVVQVNGVVRLEERKEGEERGFSESLVLVPNPDENWERKGGRRWVISSQCFRFVV